MRPTQALKEIREFIGNLKLDGSYIDPNSKSLRTLYRRFHALLIWDLLVDRDEFDNQTRLYMRECVSDISAAYFLTATGVYKPARLSLRSGIENAFRVLISERGHQVSDFQSVPELVTAAKTCAKTENQRTRAGNLYSQYGHLCLTVHSVDKKYMSLEIPFDKIINHDRFEFDNNIRELDTAIKIINQCLFVSLANHLHILDYRNADLIRDAIEAVIKGEFVALSST